MFKLLKESNIKNKVVLLRLDLNVPIYNNKILSDFRIKKSIPTIENLLKNKNKIIILSHLGRPNEDEDNSNLSLKKISEHLSKIINQKIVFQTDWINGIDFEDSNIVMCENVRFQQGEKSNSIDLSRKLASLAEVFVFDAFGVSHRKEASTYGVTDFLDSYAGVLLQTEIETATHMIQEPKKPLTTIISGSKISTKFLLIEKFLEKSSYLILGGGILNTFLKALGYNIGDSLIERGFLNDAKKIINKTNFNKIVLPDDVVCSNNKQLDNPKTKSISMVQSNDKILDIGKNSIDKYIEIIKKSETVFWNGPLGYIEKKPYDNGTIRLSHAIASSNCYSVAGGGDTIPIIENLRLEDSFSHLSTGGGSLLKFLEGKKLPILEKLGVYSS